MNVKVKRDTNKTETIVVPSGFVTDLASVPRAMWAFIAPFDVARAAIIHDLLYKTIRQYRWKMKDKEDKDLISKAKKASDKVFYHAMKDASPSVPYWKIYSSWKAVDLFGNSSIVPNKDNIQIEPVKTWLVFYFLINGLWTPGDFAQPDGWSSIRYDTMEECLERKQYADDNFIPSLRKDLRVFVKVTCQTLDPKIYWKRSVTRPTLPARVN